MTEKEKQSIMTNIQYAQELCQSIINMGWYSDNTKHMKDLEDLIYMIASQVRNSTYSYVRLNPDTNHVAKIRSALQKTEGYCPCKIQKSDDTFCMCKEFREQIVDENFYGKCHCGLYEKVKMESEE